MEPTNAHPLMDPILPAINSFALVTANECGLFDAIASGHRSAEAVAAACGLRTAAVERLVAVLCRSGYLEIEAGEYRLSKVSEATLTSAGPMPFGNWLRFCRIQLQALQELSSTVRTGRHVDLFAMMSAEDRLIHQRAMGETAAPAAKWIAEQVPMISDARAMLDIGGSHGIYSAAICRAHPPMKADIYELPETAEFARRAAREWGSDEFCTLIIEDIMRADLTKRYDAAFLGNIIHHFPQEQIECLFSKLYTNLRTSGTIAVWDLSLEAGKESAAAACFSLFFYLSSGARCFRRDEIEEMLEWVGFSDIRTMKPDEDSSHGLTVGRKTGSA